MEKSFLMKKNIRVNDLYSTTSEVWSSGLSQYPEPAWKKRKREPVGKDVKINDSNVQISFRSPQKILNLLPNQDYGQLEHENANFSIVS